MDRILTTHYGLTVLGLEMDEEKVRRAREFGGGVEYKAAYLTGDTASQVKETIEDWLKGSLACFIALHACGDLRYYIIHFYFTCDEIMEGFQGHTHFLLLRT